MYCTTVWIECFVTLWTSLGVLTFGVLVLRFVGSYHVIQDIRNEENIWKSSFLCYQSNNLAWMDLLTKKEFTYLKHDRTLCFSSLCDCTVRCFNFILTMCYLPGHRQIQKDGYHKMEFSPNVCSMHKSETNSIHLCNEWIKLLTRQTFHDDPEPISYCLIESETILVWLPVGIETYCPLKPHLPWSQLNWRWSVTN